MTGNFTYQHIALFPPNTGCNTHYPSFVNWWSILLYLIAFALVWLLWTKYDKYVFKIAFVYNAIGWLCAIYAGLTANWYIGWFAWVALLSASMVMKFIFLKLDNRFIGDYKGENK